MRVVVVVGVLAGVLAAVAVGVGAGRSADRAGVGAVGDRVVVVVGVLTGVPATIGVVVVAPFEVQPLSPVGHASDPSARPSLSSSGSQASPRSSPSSLAWFELAVVGQLSTGFTTPSLSESVSVFTRPSVTLLRSSPTKVSLLPVCISADSAKLSPVPKSTVANPSLLNAVSSVPLGV